MSNVGETLCHCGHFAGQVPSRVPSRREEVRVNDDGTRSPLDQTTEAFRNVRMFNLQEGGFNQGKATTLANLAGCLSHIGIGFFAATTVTDDKHSVTRLNSHRAAPACARS